MSDTYCKHDVLVACTVLGKEDRCWACEYDENPSRMAHRINDLEHEVARLKDLVGNEDSEELDFDRTGLEQVRDWVKKERAEVEARGNIFDTLMRCVTEGGEVFTIDPEEIERVMDEQEQLRFEIKSANEAAAD